MRGIISDKGSLFTSYFWSTLYWHLSAKRQFSIAFHPKINRLTEKQNQILKHYLRIYCNYRQNNWPELLLMATFAYNNNIYSNTRKTPQNKLISYVVDLVNKPISSFLTGEASFAIAKTE